jgi:hypothetical protein
MSQDHRLQPQRFELKYLIATELARPVRDFVSSYLELDDYSLGHPDNSYEIHSVYLDSNDLCTHHATVNGDRNRFKLRLRYYDDKLDSPVFFEIKRRVDNCILKQRCPIRREAVPSLLAGQLPAREDVLSHEPRHLAAAQRFVELRHQLNATPKFHNQYLREAWVSSANNSVRVTLDRAIQVEPYFKDLPAAQTTKPTRIYPGLVVLELKFATRFPNWFQELVDRFNLMRAAAMKYSGGVELIGEWHFQNNGHTASAPAEAIPERRVSQRVQRPVTANILTFPFPVRESVAAPVPALQSCRVRQFQRL